MSSAKIKQQLKSWLVKIQNCRIGPNVLQIRHDLLQLLYYSLELLFINKFPHCQYRSELLTSEA